MTPEQIDELERRLGVTFPLAFRVRVDDGRDGAGPIAADRYVGFRPLLIWNLRHTEGLWPPKWPAHCIAIGNDGCGNEYLLDTSEARGAVLLHDHESDTLEPVADTFARFDYAPSSPAPEGDGWATLAPDAAMLTRATVPDESILEPIRRSEWNVLVSAEPDLELREYRLGHNPFAGQDVRFEAPGRTLWHGPDGDEELALHWGAITCTRPSEAALGRLRVLGDRLGARLLAGWHRPAP